MSSLQMLRNVRIAGEGTLGAVGGRIYIDTVRNLEPAVDTQNVPSTDAQRRFNFWASVKNLLPRRRIIFIAGGVVIFIGVAVCLYTASFPRWIYPPVSTKTLHPQGYNPLTPIARWSKTAVNSISQLLAGGNTSKEGSTHGILLNGAVHNLEPALDGGNMSNKGGTLAYGIFVDDKSTVQFEGKNVIDIAGFDESYGIAVKGASKVDMGAGSTTKIRIDGILKEFLFPRKTCESK